MDEVDLIKLQKRASRFIKNKKKNYEKTDMDENVGGTINSTQRSTVQRYEMRGKMTPTAGTKPMIQATTRMASKDKKTIQRMSINLKLSSNAARNADSQRQVNPMTPKT